MIVCRGQSHACCGLSVKEEDSICNQNNNKYEFTLMVPLLEGRATQNSIIIIINIGATLLYGRDAIDTKTL